MDKEIAYLKTEDGLEFRLNEDKLFINSSVSQEAIALRSLTGIAIVDDVDGYNSRISGWKTEEEKIQKMNKMGLPSLVIGGAFSIAAFLINVEQTRNMLLIFGVFLLIGGYMSKNAKNKFVKPSMRSFVRLHTSSGTREFEFDKKSIVTGDVANFVARVEDTLTAFHKN